MKEFKNWNEVIQPTWFGWHIKTTDPVLVEFLTGDAQFWTYHGDPFRASGGNCINWTKDGDFVILSHQYFDEMPSCKIKFDSLMAVISRLKGR